MMTAVSPQDDLPFGGAKIAVLFAGRVLTLLRDNRPDIPFPAMWDLPGGGREGQETARACALRELQEELGLTLDPDVISWAQAYPPEAEQTQPTWFFVAEIDPPKPGSIRLGDEGQGWKAMPVAEFLHCQAAIPHLRARLASYVAAERY